MAKVTVEMTQLEYNLCVKKKYTVMRTSSGGRYPDVNAAVKNSFKKEIARAVSLNANLSDYVQVDVEINIVG